jgi:hypothetical protein
MGRKTLKRAQETGTSQREKTMNHSTGAALKTPSADRAVSAEGALNTAIVNADIAHSFEDYLALVDQYYADDVEVSSDTSPQQVVGKDRVKSILLGFLGPLHMIAEIGGLWVSIRGTAIPGDSIDVQHSEWTLELIGVTGRRVTSTWSARRIWKQSRVVSEYHYAHSQEGEALTVDDLWIAAPGDLDTLKPS